MLQGERFLCLLKAGEHRRAQQALSIGSACFVLLTVQFSQAR